MQRVVREEQADNMDEQHFLAYCVIWYATRKDQENGADGCVRYVLTEKETQDMRKRHEVSSFEKINVVLTADCVKMWTPEGNCGIRTSLGIIGLHQAIEQGLAVVQ